MFGSYQTTVKSYALVGKKYCDLLFKVDRQGNHLEPEERRVDRLKYVKPIMDEFYETITNWPVLAKSKLGEAVEYALNQKKRLYIFFEDGRLELSNNRAERAIKELVIGRKNWLFSKSFHGARASGIILSIIRTARVNNLNIRKYMTLLFEQIPNLPSLSIEFLEAYLPWDPKIQELCGEVNK
ncbi:MAG: transposase [Streptococcaceae bacterium]|nr:transposase [Streptococcaceae bacterium]